MRMFAQTLTLEEVNSMSQEEIDLKTEYDNLRQLAYDLNWRYKAWEKLYNKYLEEEKEKNILRKIKALIKLNGDDKDLESKILEILES